MHVCHVLFIPYKQKNRFKTSLTLGEYVSVLYCTVTCAALWQPMFSNKLPKHPRVTKQHQPLFWECNIISEWLLNVRTHAKCGTVYKHHTKWITILSARECQSIQITSRPISVEVCYDNFKPGE